MAKILVSLSLIFLSSCVNIALEDVSTTPYESITYTRPSASTYKQVESNQTDAIWINKTNGTIISSKSECSKSVPSLRTYVNAIINDLEDSKVLISKKASFNGRPGTRKVFTAKIDEIKTYFDVVSFKKHGCIFLLSRNGLEKGFVSSQRDFESFLKSFRVNKL